MKLIIFLLLLSYIPYIFTKSIEKIFMFPSYGKIEYDPSIPSLSVLEVSSYKNTDSIYLTFKTNDNFINGDYLDIEYTDTIPDFGFQPIRTIRSNNQKEPNLKSKKDYLRKATFVIPLENRKYLVIKNLQSDGNIIELENAHYLPLGAKIGIGIVAEVFLVSIFIGLIFLTKIRDEKINQQKQLWLKGQNKKKKEKKKKNITNEELEIDNDVIKKPMRSTGQVPQSINENDSTEEDFDNELNIIH